MTPISRRAILALPAVAWAQPPVAAQSSLALHLAAQLDNLAAEWDARRAAITTPAAFQNRIRFIQARVREMLGPIGPDTPLHAEVTRITQRDGYHIENLLYQSAPNLWVTANLYVPASPGPHPAVLSPCGHYEISRQHPDYQRAYILLAHAGFLVLAYDPTGQGERRQYWDPVTRTQQDKLRNVDEHSLSGHLLLLLGQSLTIYLVRDGMRGIDYLLSRPDVDPQRIACAGHSGGGTLTMFLAHADPRIRCVVINEGGTFHRWPMHLQPGAKVPIADAEQNLFPAAIHGIDACDLHSAIAPRPLLALIENYTPAFQETAAHIRRRYSLLGHDADFETAEAQAPHAWTQKLRLATADFLSRHLLQKNRAHGRAAGQPRAARCPQRHPIGILETRAARPHAVSVHPARSPKKISQLPPRHCASSCACRPYPNPSPAVSTTRPSTTSESRPATCPSTRRAPPRPPPITRPALPARRP